MPKTKHGMTKTPEYKAWSNMRQRCLNPNDVNYEHYGGRGITICERWDSFTNFFEDMGAKPKSLTLDRVDNSLGYFKDNCRWTNWSVQRINRRLQRSNTSGYRGVSFSRLRNKWLAGITVNNKARNLGYYNTKEEAALAYDRAAIDLHGDCAKLNCPGLELDMSTRQKVLR